MKIFQSSALFIEGVFMTIDVKYETGVLWQDFQHKQLIDLFNKLRESKLTNTDKNLYKYTLAFLAMYANQHFELEEEYMGKYNYPQIKRHSREHKIFVKELKKFRKENSEFSDARTDKLLTSMGEWILEHILEDDKKLGEFILNKEQTKT
jgi:hemerythrin